MGFIDRPHSIWWRKMLFQIHLWCGLVVGIYIAVISVSGCVLVFRAELTADAVRLPFHPASAMPLSWDKIIALSRGLHPDYRVYFLQDESVHNKSLQVTLVKSPSKWGFRRIDIDPFTGAVLSDRPFDPSGSYPIYSFFDDLHIYLFSGETGRTINGFGGGVLFILCVTGIMIWWPGKKMWRHAVSVKWKAKWRRVNFDTHRALGFWTLIAVSMWAVTGMYLGFNRFVPQLLQDAKLISPVGLNTRTDWKPADGVLSVDEISSRAHRAFPHAQIETMFLPIRAGESFRIFFAPSVTPYYLNQEAVLLHPGTGEIIYSWHSWNYGTSLDHFIWLAQMMHMTRFEPLSLRIVFALVGLSPAILAITGGLMWWNRVFSKRRERFRKQTSDIAS